jgi:hypothetical protein
LCLTALIDQRRFERMIELHRNGVSGCKIILKLPNRTPSLLQDCASLSGRLALTTESGMRSDPGTQNKILAVCFRFQGLTRNGLAA